MTPQQSDRPPPQVCDFLRWCPLSVGLRGRDVAMVWMLKTTSLPPDPVLRVSLSYSERWVSLRPILQARKQRLREIKYLVEAK